MQVKRYWPADAAKNKGDPWFTAVVTDYDPVTRWAALPARACVRACRVCKVFGVWFAGVRAPGCVGV